MKRFRLILISTLLSSLFTTTLTAQGWYWQNPLPTGETLNAASFTTVNTGTVVGESGTILRTTDGGTSWTGQISGTRESFYGVSFTDESTGTAVGINGIIFRTINGGRTWASRPSGTSNWLLDVSFFNTNIGVAVGQAGIILWTTDGGESWTPQSSGTTNYLWEVALVDDHTGTAVGEGGVILHTTNGGATWVTQQSGTTLWLFGITFVNASTGIAVGEDGVLLRTTNGGGTWTSVASGTKNRLTDVSLADTVHGIAVGGDGIVIRTTDSGLTWTTQSSGTDIWLLGVDFVDGFGGTAMGYWGTVIHTTDGGETWINQSSTVTFNELQSVSFATQDTGTAVGNTGMILHTTDGGVAWTIQTSGTVQHLRDVSFIDGSIGTVVGVSGTILRTVDGGDTWASQSAGTSTDLFRLSMTDRNTGTAVGGTGTILRTTNGGSTWISQPSGTTFGLYGVSFTDSNVGTAVGGEGNQGIILRTTNGGTTWISQASGTVPPLYAVSIVDSNLGIAVGYEGTIVRTSDGGQTWTTQFSWTRSDLLDVSFYDSNNGTAVGVAGAIVHTTDGGVSWSSQLSWATYILNGVSFSDAGHGSAVGDLGTILRTSTGGIGTTPSPPTLVSPPNGATVSGPATTLAWIFSPGALFYSLQVSHDSSFVDLVVNQSHIVGTTYLVSDLGNHTTYYWRVNASNNLGTSNWSEIWTFAVSDFPAQVDLLAPDNGAVITGTKVQLMWARSSPDVDRYWLEGDTDSLFEAPFADSLLTDTTFTVAPLHDNQTFWWKVKAHNVVGWGPFSEARSFFVFQEVPAPPQLVSPSDSAIGVALNPTLHWNPSNGAQRYAVQMSDTIDFSNLHLDQDSISTDTLDISGLSNSVTYYWRVAASNALGSSPWSLVWSFTTIVSLPAQVSLVLPDSGTIVNIDSTLFLWQMSEPQIDRYWFELITPKGSQIDSTVSDTSTIVHNLVSGWSYSWKVRAHNSSGWGPFSETSVFSVLITGVKDLNEIPKDFSLSQNYPNPFNPSTTIKYGLPKKSHVKLEIYNVLGQSVVVLADGEQEPGYHSVNFESSRLASGLYLYRFQAGDFVETKKLIVLR